MSIDRTGLYDSKQVLAAALFGILTYCCVYALQNTLHLPGLLYDPQAHAWLIGSRTAGVQMRYFNNLATASVAGMAVSLLRLHRRGAAVAGWVPAPQQQ
jgi:hypothetical protein